MSYAGDVEFARRNRRRKVEAATVGRNFIPAAECAALALKGLDLGLFYIPTHAHIPVDMGPRLAAVREAVRALGLEG